MYVGENMALGLKVVGSGVRAAGKCTKQEKTFIRILLPKNADLPHILFNRMSKLYRKLE